jgi:hypothetical protein
MSGKIDYNESIVPTVPCVVKNRMYPTAKSPLLLGFLSSFAKLSMPKFPLDGSKFLSHTAPKHTLFTTLLPILAWLLSMELQPHSGVRKG